MSPLVLHDGLLAIDREDLTGDQDAALRRVFPCARDAGSLAGTPPDIIVRGAATGHDAALAARPPVGEAEYDLLDDRETPTILFRYRGRPDLLITLSTPAEVCCLRGAETSLNRVNVHITWVARQVLARRGALLCHGAALERDGRALLLFGAPLARKTALVLHLIKAGWRLIADDKFILRDGEVFAIEHRINLRAGHLDAFPDLAAHPILAAAFRQHGRRRRAVLDRAIRRLPQSLAPLLQRFRPKEFQGVAAQSVFGPDTMAMRAPVGHAVLLSRRVPVGVSAAPPDQLLSQIAALQTMYPQRLARLSLHLAAMWPDQAVDPRALLAGSLGSGRLLNAHLPWSIPTQDAAGRLIDAL